jgi:hypothetical protein
MAVDSPECNCRSEVVRAVEIGNHHFIHPNSRLRWKSLLPRRQVGGFCVTFCRNFMEPGATSEGGCEAQSPGLTTARTLPAKHVQLNCRNTAASCLQPFTNWPGGEKVVSRRQYSRHEICHEHRSPGRFSTECSQTKNVGPPPFQKCTLSSTCQRAVEGQSGRKSCAASLSRNCAKWN